MVEVTFTMLLCTVILVLICWHVKRLDPHGLLPRIGKKSCGLSCALTRRSSKFLGCLYAIIAERYVSTMEISVVRVENSL